MDTPPPTTPLPAPSSSPPRLKSAASRVLSLRGLSVLVILLGISSLFQAISVTRDILNDPKIAASAPAQYVLIGMAPLFVFVFAQIAVGIFLGLSKNKAAVSRVLTGLLVLLGTMLASGLFAFVDFAQPTTAPAQAAGIVLLSLLGMVIVVKVRSDVRRLQ